MNIDLTHINVFTLGITGMICYAWLIIVNILKAGWIPVEIPARWRPLVANLGAALTTIAILHLAGAPIGVAIVNGLLPLVLAPSALHANTSGPTAKPETVPVEIQNPEALQSGGITNQTIMLPEGTSSADVAAFANSVRPPATTHQTILSATSEPTSELK